MDDGRGPDERPSVKEAFRALGELDEVQDARRLPAIVVGFLLAFPIFIVVATVLGIVLYGGYAVFRPTGAIASAIGLVWFGGSLLLTGIAVRPLLRRVNAFFARRGWPTLY